MSLLSLKHQTVRTPKTASEIAVASQLLSRRAGAVIIDYLISGMTIGAAMSLIYGISFKGQPLQTDFYSFAANGYSLTQIGILLTIILALGIFYLVILPLRSKDGATLGKKFMRLSLRNRDGSPIRKGKLFFRQFVVLGLLLGLSPVGSYCRQFLSLLLQYDLDSIRVEIGLWTVVLAGCWMALRNSRYALWDHLFKTEVVGK